MLIERGVSLPWENGIAATLLLPSAGKMMVRDGKVWAFSVPFDAAASGLEDGETVEIRYDPDDARAVYLICGVGRTTRALACAFEHRTNWYELAEDLVFPE